MCFTLTANHHGWLGIVFLFFFSIPFFDLLIANVHLVCPHSSFYSCSTFWGRWTAYLAFFDSPAATLAAAVCLWGILSVDRGVCAIIVCVQAMVHGCLRQGFWTCAQVLMHVVAHWGCKDWESALKVDTGRKIHLHTGEFGAALAACQTWCSKDCSSTPTSILSTCVSQSELSNRQCLWTTWIVACKLLELSSVC